MANGELAYFKHGSIVRFQRGDVEELLEAWRVEAPQARRLVALPPSRASRVANNAGVNFERRKPDSYDSLMDRLT
jgi:hypothetical protein